MDRKRGIKEKGEEAEKKRNGEGEKKGGVVLRLSASEERRTEGDYTGEGNQKERKWEREEGDQEKGSGKGRRETKRKEVEREEGDQEIGNGKGRR
jgi:hypothetical protein